MQLHGDLGGFRVLYAARTNQDAGAQQAVLLPILSFTCLRRLALSAGQHVLWYTGVPRLGNIHQHFRFQ
jgi:hypothetical protein